MLDQEKTQIVSQHQNLLLKIEGEMDRIKEQNSSMDQQFNQIKFEKEQLENLSQK